VDDSQDVFVLVEHGDGTLAVLPEQFEDVFVVAVVPDVWRLLDVVAESLGFVIGYRQRDTGEFAL